MNSVKKIKRKVERLDARFDRQASRGSMYHGEMTSKKDQRRYRSAERKVKKAEGTKREERVKDKYGYNYKRADELGYKPDETGHMASIDEETGLVLKGKKHPTIYKTKKYERALGYKIKRKDGKMYSVKKKK